MLRIFLKTFSQIDGVSENLNSAVYKKAVCSFGDLRPAEKVADEVLQKVIKGAVLIELKEAVIKSVKRLKPYYSYLLSVHYGILDVEKPNELNKDRNYYRSLAYAVGKFSKEMEKEGLIRGYKAIIDWESLDSAKVSAIIELKVTPQRDVGFEQIAETIMRYTEVESVYLMSGTYDFCVIVKGKTFQEVAMFVAKRLAPMDGVISTATHFILRRYKECDIELCGGNVDDRENYSL